MNNRVQNLSNQNLRLCVSNFSFLRFSFVVCPYQICCTLYVIHLFVSNSFICLFVPNPFIHYFVQISIIHFSFTYSRQQQQRPGTQIGGSRREGGCGKERSLPSPLPSRRGKSEPPSGARNYHMILSIFIYFKH